jgi:hypothetical protein
VVRERSTLLDEHWQQGRMKRRLVVFLLGGCSTVVLLLSGCSNHVSAVPQSIPNASTPLTICPAPADDCQTVEPQVIQFAQPFNGFEYYMVTSGYPESDAHDENPSIMVSNDGLNWTVPNRLENPLSSPPCADDPSRWDLIYVYESSCDFDQDPTIVYDGEKLNVYWVLSLTDEIPTNTPSFVEHSTSTDGAHWSPPQSVITEPFFALLAPSVVYHDGIYHMFTIDPGANAVNCIKHQVANMDLRTSSDGLAWSAPITTDIEQDGFIVWHPNMTWIPELQEYWAVIADYPVGSGCGYDDTQGTSMFFYRSLDGVHWISYPKPLLSPSESGWDNDFVYRGSVLYDATTNTMRVWYSARDHGGAWHTGYTQGNLDSFLAWEAQ